MVNYFVSTMVDKLNQFEICVTDEIFNTRENLQSQL